MNPGIWDIPMFNRPQSSNYQCTQRQTYVDNFSGVTDDVHQVVKVSPGKYEYIESRKYTADIPRILNKTPDKARKAQNKRKPALSSPKKIKSTDCSPSGKVPMEIYLERFDTGVFLTKVRVGKRVRWQNVKYEKQALRYHAAIKRFQTVMSSIDRMKNYKTLQISLTKEEAARYKAGDLLEGVSNNKQPKSNQGITLNQVYNYYQQNNIYDAGPSDPNRCIGDNDDDDETDGSGSSDTD